MPQIIEHGKWQELTVDSDTTWFLQRRVIYFTRDCRRSVEYVAAQGRCGPSRNFALKYANGLITIHATEGGYDTTHADNTKAHR